MIVISQRGKLDTPCHIAFGVGCTFQSTRAIVCPTLRMPTQHVKQAYDTNIQDMHI